MIDQYFMELFERIPRQGPGSFNDTKQAFDVISLQLPQHPTILDIGCGKGKQTIDLAKLCSGQIIALDNHEPFLNELEANAVQEGFENQIDLVVGDMKDMPFEEKQFDLIWAEGSIFIMGLQNGISNWNKFLKNSGFMVFSEAVYLKEEVPEELFNYFEEEYPEILTIDEAIEEINNIGAFQLQGHFTISDNAWRDNFYNHLERELKHQKVNTYIDNPEALETVQYLEKEIDTYNRFHEYFGYEFFILKKV